MAKSFNTIRDKVKADPTRAARIAEKKHTMELALALADAREAAAVSQREVADRLDVTQANVSRIENQGDIHLSTLANYVGALGGRLEVEAVFKDQRVTLVDLVAADDKNRAGTPRKGRRAGRTTRS